VGVCGEWKNYFMSLIFRYVHYELYNLCFCFFLPRLEQQQEQHQGYFFVFVRIWKRKKNTKKIFITDIRLKTSLYFHEKKEAC
jgi:hypothetical protein